MAFAKGDLPDRADFGQLVAQPFFQIIEDGLCIFLTQSTKARASGDWPLACFSTPYNCAIRLMASLQWREPCAANTSTMMSWIASDVGHAGHFRGFTFTEHAVETGIAIRMHPALITRQVLDRVLTLSIHCELPLTKRRAVPVRTAGQIVCLCACGARAGPWSFVSGIGPDGLCQRSWIFLFPDHGAEQHGRSSVAIRLMASSAMAEPAANTSDVPQAFRGPNTPLKPA